MGNYREFLDSVDEAAYHKGEWTWQEDGFTVYRTHPYTPPGCHNSCACLMYMKDGILDHVEGDPLEPYNNGKLCMRCLNMPEATNHKDRIKYPMRRVGERGENKWERISWDEALDEIVEKVNYFHEEYGYQSIMVVRGTGRDIGWASGVLAHMGVLSPMNDIVFNIGFSCYTPRTLGSNAVFGDYWLADASAGHEDRYNNAEWRAPGTCVIWANEPLKSNDDGYLGHWLVQCMQYGTKFITVDPRLTWWSVRSEYWLQLRPGTDAALAMGMLNCIVTEDLYDHEFVENWCYGFEEMCQTVAEWTPERTAEVCDVSADDIRGAARLFATQGPGTVQWGLALDQCPGSPGANLGIMSLIAICGYVDVPGGAAIIRNAYGFPNRLGEDVLPPEILKLRAQKVAANAVWGETRQPLWDWESHSPNRVRMAFFMTCNTLGNTAGDPGRVYDAIKNSVEYGVGIDPYLTPTTASFCDILLPVAMSIERNSIRNWWTPLRCTHELTTYEECKTDEEIAIMITNKLHPGKLGDIKNGKDLMNYLLAGGSLADKNAKDWEQAISQDDDDKAGEGKVFNRIQAAYVNRGDKWPEDKDFDALKEMNYSYDSFSDQYYKHERGILRADNQPGFNTPTGRIELYSLMYQTWGINPLPEHIEPTESPISTPERYEKYPLILNSGVRSYEFFHSEHRQQKTMREFHMWPQVCMNQNVADKYGIKEGEWTWIENDQGRFKQVAHIVPTLKDYVISAESGWWFPEDDAAAPTLFRTFDSNPNCVIDIEKVGPYGIGSMGKCTLVTIYPVKEGDISPTQQIVELGGFAKQKAFRESYQAKWND